MLYIVRVFEGNDTFEYEYGNLEHAEYQYAHEETAEITEYNNGKEKVLRSKLLGEEREV